MRLATFIASAAPRFGFELGGHLVDLPGAYEARRRTHGAESPGDQPTRMPDTLLDFLHAGEPAMHAARSVAAFARRDGMLERLQAVGMAWPMDGVAFLPPVPNPGKIVCLGLNYRNHVLEMGREIPEHPTIFAKFANALVGDRQPILMPAVSSMLDYEVELAFIIGRTGKDIPIERALDHVAGYTILNDVSVRDYQRRTLQWLQGKTFDRSTPIGPWLVTADEAGHGVREVMLRLNGEMMQQSSTAELIFDPAALVHYCSQIMTLEPGDVFATGTPGGVGFARTPQVFMKPGDVVEAEIEGLGVLRNPIKG